MRSTLTIILALSLPGLAMAQDYGGIRGGNTIATGGSGYEARGRPRGAKGIKPWTTGEAGPKAVKALAVARQVCAGLPDPAYRVDCIAERLAWVAYKLPEAGPYADTRVALERAAEQINAAARAGADRAKGSASYRWGNAEAQRTLRPVVPVRPEAQARANRKAEAILAETQTVLLRSSTAEPGFAPEIRQIATAVGSNKVLLRST